jgi:WD40 repeat protein
MAESLPSTLPVTEPELKDAGLARTETGSEAGLPRTETGPATGLPPVPVGSQPASGQFATDQPAAAPLAGSQALDLGQPAPQDQAPPVQDLPDLAPSTKTLSARIGEAKGPRKGRPNFRRLAPILGLILLAMLVAGALWLVNERRPPALQLTPIERPAIPINLETQSRLVSLGQWEVDANCRHLGFSPDSTTLASGCNREQVRFSPYRHYASLWQVESGELKAHLTGHTGWMLALDFSPDGATLATSADDEFVRFWQVADGELTFSIHSGQGPVAGLDFSPNGKLLAGAIWNGAGLWQVNNGNLLRTYPIDENNLTSITFSPDGETLAGGSGTGEIYVWNVSDGALIYTLPGHTAQVNQVAFSPAGTHLTSASDDHFLKLWLLEDGSLISTLSGHTEGVTSLAYSPDGSLIASGSWDGTLRLWQASDGQFLRAIETGASNFGVGFSPDGAWLVNAADDGRLLFWGISEALSMFMLPEPDS